MDSFFIVNLSAIHYNNLNAFFFELRNSMNIWLLPSTVAERPLYTENTNTNRYPPPIYISTPPHKNFHRQHRRNALQSSYLFFHKVKS